MRDMQISQVVVPAILLGTLAYIQRSKIAIAHASQLPLGTGDISVGLYYDQAPGVFRDAVANVFSPDLWEDAACISYHETKGWTEFVLDTRGKRVHPGTIQEYSVGPWQINLLAHPEVSYAQAMDWRWSTEYAYMLYNQRGNWGDWYFSAGICGLDRGS